MSDEKTAPKLTSIEFGYGHVRYFKGVEAEPATTQTEGSVTINNAAIPAVPSSFEVSRQITANFEVDGLKFYNIFSWNCEFANAEMSTPYIEVDSQAARMIAPMLRAVADQIETEVAEFDKEFAKKKSDKDES